jgi:ABC-type branched-subunit amino acid transport system substrate-binding protein
VTATSIKIEGICPITSPTGGYPGCDVGAKARFDAVNRAGGINGRTIDYIGTKDDKENGATNLSLSHQAVQQDKVFAVVPELGEGFLPASSDYFNTNQVPSVGWGFMPGQCAGPDTYGFGFNGCVSAPSPTVTNISVAAPLVETLGKDKAYALISDNTQVSTTGLMLVNAAFRYAGANIVYSKANVPLSANVNYTPFVADIMVSNHGKAPDVVVTNGQFQNTVGLSAALKAAGYKGALANYIAYVPGLLENSPDTAKALDGAYVATQFLPTEFGGPSIEKMQADVKAVDPKAPILLGTALSYWSADVFVQMLQAAGKDLTAASFGQTVNGGWTYKPAGDPIPLGPVSYPDDHTQAAPCGALVQISGTKYLPIKPLTCYKNVALADIPK